MTDFRVQRSLCPRRLAIAAILVAVAALCLAACGGEGQDEPDLPANAVAKVGNTVLTKQDVQQLVPADADELPRLQREGTERVILLEWFKREAKHEGIEHDTLPPRLSAQEARTPAIANQAKFLDLYFALVHKSYGARVTPTAVTRHYQAHEREYASPEVRFMKLVATDSRAQAEAAARELEKGREWQEVIDQHGTRTDSIAPRSGDMGAGPGEMPAGLDEAVYTARMGTINGPVKTDQAWYVFQLTSIDPLPRQSMATVRRQIASKLARRRQEQARNLLKRRLVARYRPLTICAEKVRLPYCNNGPSIKVADVQLIGL